MASGEYRKQWHKYLSLAILNYNTTYHSSIVCEPSRVFHGRVPDNILDHKLGLRFNPNIAPTTDFAEELLRRTKILYDKTKKNVMQSYIKYKKYYDKKAKASPLKEKDYCFLLQPKADHQGSKISFRDFRWIGTYLVEKVLPNNNYIVRKLDTNKTQILHRIRLRKYNPEKPPDDNYQEIRWQIDDNIVVPQDDLYTFALEAEFGGHLFDIAIIYTDLNAIDFDDKDQILLSSHVPIFMNQAMVKTGKHAPFLTHLYHKIKRLNRMVKVRTLRALLASLKKIISNEHLSQVETLKLHANL